MVTLDQAFIDKIYHPILRTWDSIAPDLDAFSEEPIDNETAIECCIDADRLTMFGGKDGGHAQCIIGEAFSDHGTTTVYKFIESKINLV